MNNNIKGMKGIIRCGGGAMSKEILNKILQAQKLMKKAEDAKNAVFEELNKKFDLETGKGGFWSSNAEEAVSCFIDYGEGSIDEIAKCIESCEELNNA